MQVLIGSVSQHGQPTAEAPSNYSKPHRSMLAESTHPKCTVARSKLSTMIERKLFDVLALIVLALAVAVVLPFVPAILWATVLSVLMYAPFEKWQKRFASIRFLSKGSLPASLASIGATLSAMLIVVLPFAIIGIAVYQQGQHLADQIGASGDKLSIESVLHYVDQSSAPLLDKIGVKEFNLSGYLQENRPQVVQTLKVPVTHFATQTGYTILTLIVALLTMFFMLRDANKLREPALRLIPLPRQKAKDLLIKVAETIRAVFVGTVLVAIIQGAIMGVTYHFLGVRNALLLGVFSVLLCIIPLLGAPVIYIPVGLMFLLQGDVTRALVTLGVGGLIVSQIDNVLKPTFIAGRANLHPMAVFFAILGGVILIGPIGVMAGPMLLTVALALLEAISEMRAVQEGQS